MKVGLIIIATNRYIRLVPDLVESARRFFLRGHDVTTFVLTNMPDAPAGVVRVEHAHESWPRPTLHRYHAFLKHRELFAGCDYLFYCDADMRFASDVGDDIFGDLVAVNHPGFYDKPRTD